MTGSNSESLVYSYNWSVNGTIVQSGPDRSLDLSRPGLGDVGQTISVSVSANDGRVDLTPGVASVTVANSLPVVDNATLGASLSVSLHRPFAFPLPGRDADGDALSFAVASDSALPPGVTITSDGVLGGEPTQNGTFYFNLNVSDGRGGVVLAKYILIVRDVADGVGPIVTRGDLPTPVTRDQLAGLTLAGMVRDIAPTGVAPSGVNKLLVQLRRVSDGYAYNGSSFTSNVTLGYYAATLSAATSDKAAPRTWERALSWLPAESKLTPGLYLLNILAQDKAGNSSANVVSFTIIQTPAPVALDALVAPGASPAAGDYVGQGVVSTDPALQSATQTIDAGATQTFSVQVRKRGASEEVTLQAHASRAGWIVAYFDGAGNNITAALTGTGWRKTMADGQSVDVLIQVTPPLGAPEGERCAVVVSAQTPSAGSGSNITDVVRALAIAHSPLPAAQPDVAISALDENNLPGEYIGIDQLSPTIQPLTAVLAPNTVQKFALQITNKSAAASAFALTKPTLPAGWTLQCYDALEDGALLEGELVTPAIEPGESVVWRVEVTAQAPATRASLPLRLSGGSLFDEVEINAGMQSLAGLQWSRDGQTWTDVTATTLITVQRNGLVGLRALKPVPDLDWPYPTELRPKWSVQGHTLFGDTVWVHFPKVVPDQTLSAECGNTASVSVHVTND